VRRAGNWMRWLGVQNVPLPRPRSQETRPDPDAPTTLTMRIQEGCSTIGFWSWVRGQFGVRSLILVLARYFRAGRFACDSVAGRMSCLCLLRHPGNTRRSWFPPKVRDLGSCSKKPELPSEPEAGRNSLLGPQAGNQVCVPPNCHMNSILPTSYNGSQHTEEGP